MGRIADGTTVSDYHVSEKQRQISTQASLLHTEWLGKKLNIIDTPGYLDFLSEALAVLRVADCALVVIHAQHGAGVGTERVWNCASDCGIPKILVVNAMDKPNVRFDDVLATRARTSARGSSRSMCRSIPSWVQSGARRAAQRPRHLRDYRPRQVQRSAGRGRMEERVTQLHRELIELIAESDDTLLTKFFDEGGLSEEELRAGIHAAVQRQHFIPLFCLSAESDIGVARLLDFIAKHGRRRSTGKKPSRSTKTGRKSKSRSAMPSPSRRYSRRWPRSTSASCRSFASIPARSRPSGALQCRSSDHGAHRPDLSAHGRDREAVSSLHAGDLGAMVKLKDTHTGNTLCAPGRHVAAWAAYPEPAIHAALQAVPKARRIASPPASAMLPRGDPAFQYRVDSELQPDLVSAQGELHLQVIAERLRRRFNVHVELIERGSLSARPSNCPPRRTTAQKQTGGAGSSRRSRCAFHRRPPRLRDRLHRIASRPGGRSSFTSHRSTAG